MSLTRITVVSSGQTTLQPAVAGAPLTVLEKRYGATIVVASATTGPRGTVTPELQALVGEAEQFASDAAISAAASADVFAEINVLATPQIIAARQITLPSTPRDRLAVQLTIYPGPPQRAGVDFLVGDDNILSWASLALELLLEAGDAFVVRFIKRVN